MTDVAVEDILTKVQNKELTVAEATEILKREKFVPIKNTAIVDTGRKSRTGKSEVVYGKSKTDEQILEICRTLAETNDFPIIVTGAGEKVARNLKEENLADEFVYEEKAKIVIIGKAELKRKKTKPIAVMTAGTSDIPVAEEAALTAEAYGNVVKRIYDVGVAGIHRLFAYEDEMREAGVIIVCAGMEGALASVVAGIVSVPVIAVPTSIGYGAAFEGLAALLGMLNSCSPGVSVVNIDNGFGAGYLADIINEK